MGERGRRALAAGAGCGATLLVAAVLGLLGGTLVGAEDNGDGHRLFCGVGLRPLTIDTLSSWKGGVVGDFALGEPTCGMSVPSSAALLLRAAGLGGDTLSLVTVAWWYAVLVGIVVGLAAWAACAAGAVRAAVLVVPVAPLALPAFSRFFASTYGEPAGLLGTVAAACGIAALLVVDPGRRREHAVATALTLAGGGVAATAKPAYLPVLGVALAVGALVLVRTRRRPAPRVASAARRSAAGLGVLAAVAAVAVPVWGAVHFQEKIYEGANVHDVVFTMALAELGPGAVGELGLPAAAVAATGHGYFNGPPRPTGDWYRAAIGERPAALRGDALGALLRSPPALLRTLGVGLQATGRADLPYLASSPADPRRPSALAGDVGWSGADGPELRAVLAAPGRPPWLPTAVVLAALAAAAGVPAWGRRAPAAARWCLAAGLAAATALGLVVAALAGDGYFELFKHVWLGGYVVVVAALCLLGASGALVHAGLGRLGLLGRWAGRPPDQSSPGRSSAGNVPASS
jgi:hypothetical protein